MPLVVSLHGNIHATIGNGAERKQSRYHGTGELQLQLMQRLDFALRNGLRIKMKKEH